MKKNGFTLIELVIVIVILGILAVVATPKFMNLQVDARNASLKGLKGAIASGLGVGYAKMTIAGQETLPYVSNINNYPALKIPKQKLPFPGCTVDSDTNCTFRYGYPDYDSTSLEVVVENLNTNDWKILVPKSGSIIKITFSKYVNSSTTFDDIKQCYITYAPPASEDSNYTLTMTPCK